MGDFDLVRPLVLAQIDCAVLAPAGNPVHWSRHLRARLAGVDPETRQAEVVEQLLGLARTQQAPLVLLPQWDAELLVVSQFRQELAESCRFLLPAPELVEALTDKARFARLAEELELRTPPVRRMSPARDNPADLDLRFPIVVKPLMRQSATWQVAAKALHVGSPTDLASLWPDLVAAGVDVLAQEVIPGPETRVESYHAYVDGEGQVVAEFTGRKIRTRPARYGHSTAVEITLTEDVAQLGREVLGRLGLRGVAKVDLKRAPDGVLHLLEVNPRFNLWHHPGAVAGVNLPALVYADLVGRPRPPIAAVRPGVRWCRPLADLRAVVDSGTSVLRWIPWAMRCEAHYAAARDEPFTFFPGSFWAPVRRKALELAAPAGRT
jgi:predicted ATP-grasp superfamily ATP-dependent carboligase